MHISTDLKNTIICEAIKRYKVADLGNKADREAIFFMLPDGQFLTRFFNDPDALKKEAEHIDVMTLPSMQPLATQIKPFGTQPFTEVTGATRVIMLDSIAILFHIHDMPTDAQIEAMILLARKCDKNIKLLKAREGHISVNRESLNLESLRQACEECVKANKAIAVTM